MKIVASLTDPAQASTAHLEGADILELRLDLAGGSPVQQVRRCRELSPLPVIATLRSEQEGGRYFGNADEWIARILPVLPFADYIDIEQRFSLHAPQIRAGGKKIIASHHSLQMRPLPVLFELERELRSYGDIPKIVVTPRSNDDLIELISFTCAANKPVCTGVMGGEFRHARAILPLFGSEFAYCHAGTPTAEGQYSVKEFAALMSLLGAGHGVTR